MNSNLIFLIVLLLTIHTKSFDHSDTIVKILQNSINEKPKTLFKIWHLVFQKEYTLDSEEAKKRFAIFKSNLAEVRKVNDENLPYKLGVNQFSDLSPEEFRKIYLTEQKPKDPEVNFLSDDDDDLTKRNLQNYAPIDWKVFYPPIRDQKFCGSGWAFSACGSIDGNLGVKYRKAQPYTSPQQLVDCDSAQLGCNGGYFPNAFKYIQNNGGLMYDSDYSYKSIKGRSCLFNSKANLVKISGFKFCNNNSGVRCSESIVYGLLERGPLSVSVDASGNFQSYQSGVYTASCTTSNHAVNLVGYGLDFDTNLFYWLIRNSWSATWGDKGYLRMAVNDSNNHSCFTTDTALLPLV